MALDDKDEVIEKNKITLDEESQWKVVGGLSRRGSCVAQPQQQQEQTTRHDFPEKQWGSFGGFQWEGPSIFEEEIMSKPTRSELSFDPMSILPLDPIQPFSRHQRSLSFSMGQDSTFFGYDDYTTTTTTTTRKNSLLAPTLEEDEENEQSTMFTNNRLHHSMDDAYFRSRSQSISSAFGLYSPSNSVATTNSSTSSYWINPTTRRSSLGFIHPVASMQVEPTRILPHFPDYELHTIPKGPPPHIQQLTDMVEKTHLLNTPMFITDPVDATMESAAAAATTTTNVSAGKGVSLQKLPPHILLYMVEFKSGRTDFYYVSDTLLQLEMGDLVIVEADRGKDLGKIATDTLTINQVILLKQQQQTSNSNRLILDEEYHEKKNDTFVKKIYRKALPDEISLLLIKEQDEQKALTICLQKIKNRKLQMEVVDAEFQWDRRKLTFYFIAEKRIDFRELVRELFKIYKTRIWMCAVIPTIPLKSVTASSASAS